MTRLRFSEMTHADIPAVQSFLIKHLNLFFNAGRVMPAAEEDIFDLKQQYILQERNLLLCAWSEKQELIATLAVCQYDDRITELRGHYYLPETAEICRCYVDARYRRQGIGSRLFALAQMFCQQQKYKTLYLHTHHFLPGGYHFWLRKDFSIVMDMQDEWQLVHMQRSHY
ncbi:TPA: GNAT family N-acetyltransferase [Citrobacter freundii]|uniref:GNAT family N-acetyltransferase n=1 Tax=Citrobacter TaxID=544 RepID=UPI001C7C887E|nr:MULTISPECIES: GNAT family N-acetyltransferase [Citrobacter]MDM3086410.1 GNAT family N-acetyltransferase [Citrobacter sp. Cf141]HBI3679769.1 GNAT family N-acetyltransferase [Citrobacter freundii]HCB2474518.1 GNAT family N-acetyltransferase [Citrobacter freundii]HCJ7434760.1 GNAT family N-acetyltransferase [Citrobacter freundii]HCK3367493.1 GNAT family N-acetyltransferase [Citrobacter freundii]